LQGRSESHDGRSVANAGAQVPPTQATAGSPNGATMRSAHFGVRTTSSSTNATSSVLAMSIPAFLARERPGVGSK